MSALDPTHRSILESELAEVDRQIDDLQGTRSYLRRRLGLPDEPDSGNGTVPLVNPALAGGDVRMLVNPGQYGGRSGVKAAADLLERVGETRPLTTREIYDAITRGGVKVKDTEVLNKMMKRSGRFHRPVPGRWGLAEWYPASVRARRGPESDLSQDSETGLDETPEEREEMETQDDV